MEAIDDAGIITQILDGDRERYAVLMRKYNQRLYRVAKGYLKDEAEIEDMMQDAYVKGFLNLGKFEQRSQFSTWITRILINECLQHLRSKRLVVLGGDDNFNTMNYTDSRSPETESVNRELGRHLENKIEQLPEKYRVVFVLREVEKLSVEETSQLLDLSESNVKARLSRAREMLRAALLNSYAVDEVFEFNLIRCDRVAQKVLARICV
jgi:RNA polymerase sigma factor (sigma-70 family)